MDGSLENFAMEPVYSQYEHITPSRHLSIVFNMFVWMQIFNMLCARKINDEWNFMSKIHTNGMFIAVIAFIVGLQIFVIESWHISSNISQAFSIHFEGLTGTQWAISVVIGLVTFPINAILKLVPDTMCPILGDEPTADVGEAEQEYSDLLEISKKYGKFRENSLQKYV
jgi:magnesium-transporting ATPase (P-type)